MHSDDYKKLERDALAEDSHAKALYYLTRRVYSEQRKENKAQHTQNMLMAVMLVLLAVIQVIGILWMHS